MNRDLVNRRFFLSTSALYAACTSALATPFTFSLDPENFATTSNNITVYDLRDDTLEIESTQRTSLQSDYGIESKPALFGSDVWWRILGTEELRLLTIEGVISKVYEVDRGRRDPFSLGIAKLREVLTILFQKL
jgi:hypothetical protein